MTKFENEANILKYQKNNSNVTTQRRLLNNFGVIKISDAISEVLNCCESVSNTATTATVFRYRTIQFKKK